MPTPQDDYYWSFIELVLDILKLILLYLRSR